MFSEECYVLTEAHQCAYVCVCVCVCECVCECVSIGLAVMSEELLFNTTLSVQ